MCWLASQHDSTENGPGMLQWCVSNIIMKIKIYYQNMKTLKHHTFCLSLQIE